MKTIELTEEQYTTLLVYKNFVTMKLRGATNPEVLKLWKDMQPMPEGLNERMDFELDYSFGECIIDTVSSVMNEQETGEVNYIT